MNAMGRTPESEYFRSLEDALETRLSCSGYLVARLDGRRFSKLTSELTKPYDALFHDAMVVAAQAVAEQFHANALYTHSDEVTLVWHRPTDAGFSGRVVKLATSLAASMSVEFLVAIPERSLLKGSRPTFDCRLVELSGDDVRRNLRWRAARGVRRSLDGPAHEAGRAGQLPT